MTCSKFIESALRSTRIGLSTNDLFILAGGRWSNATVKKELSALLCRGVALGYGRGWGRATAYGISPRAIADARLDHALSNGG